MNTNIVRVILFCLCWLVSFSIFAKTENLIKNPGFDLNSSNALEYWTFENSGAGSFVILDNSPRGKKIQITRNTNAPEGSYPFAMAVGSWNVTDMIKVEQGDKFSASVMARTPQSGIIALNLACRDNSGNSLSSVNSGDVALTSGWQLITVSGTVPSGCEYVSLELIAKSGVIECDDAEFSDNLVVNSGFELQNGGNLVKWFLGTSNAGSFSVVSDSLHGGYDLRITRDDANAPADHFPFALTGGSWNTADMIKVCPGDEFLLQTLARTSQSGSVMLEVVFRSGSGGWLSCQDSPATVLTGSWQTLNLKGVIPANCQYLQVIIFAKSGTVDLDDVKYSENVVKNSGFDIVESGSTKDWMFSANQAGTINIVNNSSEKDNNLQITRSANAPAGQYPLAISSGTWNSADMIQVSTGQAVMATVLARTPQSGTAHLQAIFRNSAGNWLYAVDTSDYVLGSNWQKIVLKCNAVTGATCMQLVLISKSGVCDFDSVSLRIVNLDNLNSFKREKAEYWVNVDYNDEVCYCGSLVPPHQTYGENEIISLFQALKQKNVDGVLWRVSVLGQVDYKQTSVATVFPGRATLQMLTPELLRLKQVLDIIDPLTIAIREARNQGIKIMIWVTVSDEGFSNGDHDEVLTNNLVLDHPEYALVKINGDQFKGTLCYSVPEVRTYRLNMISELLNYNADGIYLCGRTHAEINGIDHGNEFGYNGPIADAYYQLYGVNILTQPFDTQLWLQIRASAWDTFYQQAASLVHARGQKLWAGIKTTDETRGYPYGNELYPWKSWVQNGYLDAVIVGHNFQGPGALGKAVNDFRQVAQPSQQIFSWQQVMRPDEPVPYSLSQMSKHIKDISFLGINGGAYHESINLEIYHDYWEDITNVIDQYWNP